MGKTTIQLIDEQAQSNKDKIAICFQETCISYGEMNLKANQMATYLIAKGAIKESIIGIAVDRSIEMVIA
ncbi:MAG: hypothetical protein EOO92_08920, partial [Pedobacter sp.]